MKKLKAILISPILVLFFFSCSNKDVIEVTEDEQIIIDDTDFEVTYWKTDTHGNDAKPNFDQVFEENAIKRLEFVITSTRWQSMRDNMIANCVTFGVRGGASRLINTDENPVFVPGEVFCEGK
jgi:spore coat protein H